MGIELLSIISRDIDLSNLYWQLGANCVGLDPAMFFPTAEQPTDMSELRKVCGACVVRAECLEYALSAHEVGFWGGLNDKERERIRRQRERAQIA